MKSITCLVILALIGLSSFSQSFTLPGDGNWYRAATKGGRHAFIEYYYSHPTGHNPSIAKGVEVGEFQMKLLQKVEELTLYIIEHQKEMKSLKSKNEIQQAEIKELKKELKYLTIKK